MTLISFPLRLARSANPIAALINSCVLIVKKMAFSAMRLDAPFLMARPISHILGFAFSACPTAVFSNIGIFYSKLMSIFAMGSISQSVSTIRRLFKPSRPFTVFRGIGAVIINSIYLMFGGWLKAHIRQKLFKAAYPSIADRYSSAAIVFVMRVIRVCAAPFHVAPNIIVIFSDGSFLHGLQNRISLAKNQLNNTGVSIAI